MQQAEKYRKVTVMGRPKGSLNKSTIAKMTAQVKQAEAPKEKRGRGRPKGSTTRVDFIQNYKPVVTAIVTDKPKVAPVHTYTHAEVKKIEAATGQIYIGSFSTDVGEAVPVFRNANHTDDENRAVLAYIRKG